jgi:hypothetical protein
VPDDDRSAGVLTPTDRKYIAGVYEESRQAEYSLRRKMCDRVENGLLDFQYLPGLPQEIRRELFDDMTANATDDEIYHALINAIGFVRIACDDANIEFERAVEDGLYTVLRHPAVLSEGPGDNDPNPSVGPILEEVTVDIEYEYAERLYPDRLLERWQEGEDLTATEMGALVTSDVFGPEEAAELKERKADGGEE